VARPATTDAARYCLVIAVAIDGRNYGMALLGTEGKLARFGDVARVVDWIVTHKAKLTAPQRFKTTAP